MIQSIFIERYSEYNSEEAYYTNEITKHLKISNFQNLRIIHKLELMNANSEEVETIKNLLFNDGISHLSMDASNFGSQTIELEYLDGQFDFIKSQSETMIKNLLDKDIQTNHSRIFTFDSLSDDDFQLVTKFLINPNETQLKEKNTEEEVLNFTVPLINFKDASDEELKALREVYALDLDDLKFVQTYFKKLNREANELELRLIATYWSDHCRHTTFNTEIKSLKIEGKYKDLITHSFNEYLETRKTIEHTKPFTLMDLATINAREIEKKGLMDDWDKSKEVNAASIKIDISGEEYLLLFKNETHNHPSEIEPYGGASTCIGGCVRDPMSGRATVYQAMRITGAKNPVAKYTDKHPLKLSQRQICQLTARGYSDYANQMGIVSDYLKEYYHDGFEAKRFELGALLASVKASDVQKLEPEAGDLVLVIGGRTGRDGLGAAIGSSKKQDEKSIKKAGPEVQKGDPVTERKLLRLFNNPEFTRLIKRSNDFGAGGLGVAVGELADGLDIHLDKMLLKLPLDPMEIVLSESQERMAVVIKKEDMKTVIQLAMEENLESVHVADVKDTGKLKMFYHDDLVLELDRSFLNKSGASKTVDVIINSKKIVTERDPLNDHNQEALREMFSNSNSNNTILQEGMHHLIPNLENNQDLASFMTCGYNPFISNTSPYHAGYLAVIEAVSKIVAMGGSPVGIRMSFQEYFEALHQDPYKWGKASAALLGAFQVMKELDYPSIGGKDSMSGSFNELSVPPSILCFAVQTGLLKNYVSREFKQANSTIALISTDYSHDNLIQLNEFHKNNETLHQLMNDGKVLACSTINNSIKQSLDEMSLVNDISFILIQDLNTDMMPGSYLVEVENEEVLKDLPYQVLGQTIDQTSQRKPSQLDELYSLGYWTFGNKKQFMKSKFKKSLNELPKVLIPVFSGINQELKLIKSLNQLEISYKVMVLNESDLENSIHQFCKELKDHNILFLSDGFKQVNDLFDGGLEYSLLLKHSELNKTIKALEARGGLVVGSGAGALGLIKADYFGKDIKVIPNASNKHLSMMIPVQTVSNQNCITQNTMKPREMRLDAYYCHVLGMDKDRVFLQSVNKLDEQTLDLGFQSENGQIIASLCQVEQDLEFLKQMKDYFTTGRK